MSVCCFTGHRDLGDKKEAVMKRLKFQVLVCAQAGMREFRCGGALGFDTLAAQAVLEIREQFPDVRLVLMLPCRDQDKKWSPEDRRIYREIIEAADEVKVLSEHYYRGCMFVRNRALVDGSELCIAYLKQSSGGTKMTVDYAQKKGVSVINVGDFV